MPTREEWNTIIKGRGGRTGEWTAHGGTIYGDARDNEHVDGYWFDKNPGDYKYKSVRDTTAREMRKDGWEVKSETNSLGWFFKASRARK